MHLKIRNGMGRIVLTHSSYIEGLLDWANTLAKKNGIKTITPGVIGRTKRKVDKPTFRITRKTERGYKLIARFGKTYQEVYIVCDLNLQELNELIQNK